MGKNLLTSVSLDDKYLVDRGKIFISGKQALVRLPLAQSQIDQKNGLNTAGFISGYRGSPLGGYDIELWKARKVLERHNIIFSPGLNEDLAATAVWGTQQVGFFPGRKFDGVFAIWYGKGPGVDRSGDPLKHLNLQGTDPHGGILIVFGDDHPGKSSSTAHQSDASLAAHGIPVLYPATLAEIIEFGLAAFALSRFAGLAVGLKIVNETADASATIFLNVNAISFRFPENLPSPSGGVHIRKEFLAVQEQDTRLVRYKIPRALAFARVNQLDKLVFGSTRPTFVIVTSGKAYLDVLGALDLLGIGTGEAIRLGLAVYKVAMVYPLEPEAFKKAVTNAREILFVEEKRPLMELQAARILFNLPDRPLVSGKIDSKGVELLPADIQLDPLIVATAIATCLARTMPDYELYVPKARERRALIERRIRHNNAAAATAVRIPTFCAGCPHSSSTRVPDNSFGLTGIGCHSMTVFLPERNPLPVTHMGGEGATWIGIAPFTSTRHVFQNLGDGTYNHSGSLAIRAAVQAGINITYKILLNDAVAMTGGQRVEGNLTAERIAQQMLAEGVKRIVIVSEHPKRLQRAHDLAQAVSIRHRDELDSIQRELREIPGTTVLIYDQTCAAEKRRRKKRGEIVASSVHVYINDLVCEGCGDCSAQSSCVAIQPLETELGRKRTIDQSSCNEDLSCLKGFCPSFVTIEHARVKKSDDASVSVLRSFLPDPITPRVERFTIMIAGIGGTGVTTVSNVLAMAAHLEGHGATTYDMTGLSQKGGAVFSHVRFYRETATLAPVKLGPEEADLLLCCDLLACNQKDAIETVSAGRTAVVINEDLSPTSEFQRNPDLQLSAAQLAANIDQKLDGRPLFRIAATSTAKRLLGDSIAANVMMLGFAWQFGLIPLCREAIEKAIELNGIAVNLNLRAFALGRRTAINFSVLNAPNCAVDDNSLHSSKWDDFVEHRVHDLTEYQDLQYACKYQKIVQIARDAERQLGNGSEEFSWAVARTAYKVMAYKDEYEVARLYTDGRFRSALQKDFEDGYKLRFHFSPPLIARRDPKTGRAKKISLGPGALRLLKLLARFKMLRGTPFDIFGLTSERRHERRLRDDCLELLRDLSARLSSSTYDTAVRLATAPLRIRGFGVIKHQNAAIVFAEIERDRALLVEMKGGVET